MAVSREEVRRVARLARLRFSDEEEERLTGELERILDYAAKLDDVDTAGVPPMTHPLGLENVFREDEVDERLSQEEALKNAPDADDGYFRVPKAIT